MHLKWYWHKEPYWFGNWQQIKIKVYIKDRTDDCINYSLEIVWNLIKSIFGSLKFLGWSSFNSFGQRFFIRTTFNWLLPHLMWAPPPLKSKPNVRIFNLQISFWMNDYKFSSNRREKAFPQHTDTQISIMQDIQYWKIFLFIFIKKIIIYLKPNLTIS